MSTVSRDVLTGLSEVVRAWQGSLLTTKQSMGFWEGKQFRAYIELATTNNETLLYRFRATKPFLLTLQNIQLDAGFVRIDIETGGTETGTWTALNVAQAKNRISGSPVSSVSLFKGAGASVVDGVEREILRCRAGTGGQAESSTVSTNSPRALPAGDYHIRIVASGASTGVYYLEWEDIDLPTGLNGGF